MQGCNNYDETQIERNCISEGIMTSNWSVNRMTGNLTHFHQFGVAENKVDQKDRYLPEKQEDDQLKKKERQMNIEAHTQQEQHLINLSAILNKTKNKSVYSSLSSVNMLTI